MPPKLSKRRPKLLRNFTVFKLLLAALPTIVFGVFTIVFTLQQNASSQAAREQDQQQADETNQRILFKEYIDDMEEMLLRDDFTINATKFLLHMRVRTVTVLKHLNSARKHDVIRFLYDNRLIRHDQWPTVHLNGSDLTGMQFIKSPTDSCELDYLYLPGVYAEKIVFDGCLLIGAVFDSALMSGATIQSCTLINSRFVRTDLTTARLIENQINGANFTSALLTRSSILGGISEGVDFTNADLHESDIDERQFDPIAHSGLVPNVFDNARFPNGSFGRIQNDNLIAHSRAQYYENTTVHWRDPLTRCPTAVINVGADRFFRVDDGTIAYQAVDLQRFTLLVNLEQAVFNFSAYIGIVQSNTDDVMQMLVHFARDSGSFDYTQSVNITIKNPALDRPYFLSHSIPANTKFLLASFRCDTQQNKDRFCFFDRVHLSIHKKA